MNEDNSKLLTLAGVIIGYALIGDLNANEQNALGNWFMLVGQILETNSSFLYNNGSNIFNQNSQSNDSNQDNDIELLKKAIHKIEEEIDKLKKN